MWVDLDDSVADAPGVPSFDDFETWTEAALAVLLAETARLQSGSPTETPTGSLSGPPPEPLPQSIFASEPSARSPDEVGISAPDTHFEVSMRIVPEAEIQALNKRYRQRDTPTNVLSFPSGLPRLPGTVPGTPDLLSLGDIVLCPAVIAAEASAQHKRIADHWAHLCTHGLVHLAGYDHADEATADAMESLEIRILSTLSIANPYLPSAAEGCSRGDPHLQ